MSFQNSYNGVSDEERIELENQRKKLEKQYAEGIKQKIEELEKRPEKADELNKIIAEVKKSLFFSCNDKDIDQKKTDVEQVKICLGYFINPESKSAYSGSTTSEAAESWLGSLYKSIQKATRTTTPGGGKRSRKYKQKSIKKLRKKSRHNIKKK